jgi:polyhydroxyalkanoate synthesis repressor PhaR
VEELVVAYVIKRYANRKLYDPQKSQYVTLEELEEMIRAGREITVTDATTGDDLTAMVLAQIILEKARSRRPSLPTAFLHQLVQYGEAWQDFAVASLKTSLEGIMTSQREAERILREWAAGCGWMPPAQRTSEAEPPPAVSQELTELRQEIAVLREQLQRLAARLPQEPTP